VVPKLKGASASTAEQVLKLLDCSIGRVRHEHSKRVGKGKVIRTVPIPGTYVPGQKIGLVVSAGPRRAPHGIRRAPHSARRAHHSVRRAVFYRSRWLGRSA
jgi:hypothetical protein